MPELAQTLTEKVVKGSSIVLIFTLLGSPIGYLIRVLYSHSLSIEMYGLFYAALAFFTLLSTYLDFGLGFSTAYFIPKFLKKKDYQNVATVFQYCQLAELMITVVSGIILFASAHWLALTYFKSLAAVNLVYLFAVYLIANSIFTALNTLFLGFQKEVYYSSMQFFRLVFILAFSALFWFFDIHNVLAYALTWAGGTLVVVSVYYVLVLRQYPFIFKNLKWDTQLLRSMVSYGVPTLVTVSLHTFITSTDMLFLTYFHGLREVGIYNVVYPLATIPSLFLSPVNALVLPLISHLMEGEEHKIEQLIHTILKIAPFISLYFGLFIALFATPIVTILFGAKWLGLVEIPLIIFSLGFVLAPLSTLLVTILSGMGKVKERLKLSIIILILNIILSLLLIPTYTVIGVVIANTLVYVISVILFAHTIGKSFQLVYPVQFYVKFLAFMLTTFGLVEFCHINPTNWVQIVVVGIVYTGLFMIFGWTQGLLDAKTMHIFTARLKTVSSL